MRPPKRDHVASFLIRLLLETVATKDARRVWREAVNAYERLHDLGDAIEGVLTEHVWEVEDDPSLGELQAVYWKITGFEPPWPDSP